jgi:hypothetical protein
MVYGAGSMDARSLPRSWMLLVLLALSLGAVFITCCPGGRDASKSKLELTGEAASKVDQDLRRTAARCLADGRGDEKLPVLVRIGENGTRAELEAAGMQVDSIVGDVVSGRLAARSLPEVAAIDAVIHMQLAHELEIQ